MVAIVAPLRAKGRDGDGGSGTTDGADGTGGGGDRRGGRRHGGAARRARSKRRRLPLEHRTVRGPRAGRGHRLGPPIPAARHARRRAGPRRPAGGATRGRRDRPHGGGIEVGTSELCLAVAGYHPATSTPIETTAPLYDYWLFEGLRSSGNGELHVTSTSCDDPVAESLGGGARHAVSLHGCTAGQVGLPDTGQAVVVGGLDATLKAYLRQEFAAAGITALDAAAFPALAGVNPQNIVNRTLTGSGAQLELTTPLRNAMFGTNTRAQRKNTTLPLFWTFVAATRAAVARRVAV
ncbi:poly-gamma-glutamate hydrolase family protein [Micromonospora sp. WMMA1363]|uniref:poly-gamma-glutamate hydrolase family protein n=1 Tax=Micromonospora sp. WMMA1363 TaxID=3053985 RepID=UPI00259D1E14|nr:poly-gamma-glutamate hydrolase family protein [Micromonospora sp. WMMA1363]MDM4718834.1 poly-gamma-glutamate hydrolase family protein [Micromonospora sp. WMMA1363]